MNKMWLNEAIAESLFGWGFYNRQDDGNKKEMLIQR